MPITSFPISLQYIQNNNKNIQLNQKQQIILRSVIIKNKNNNSKIFNWQINNSIWKNLDKDILKLIWDQCIMEKVVIIRQPMDLIGLSLKYDIFMEFICYTDDDYNY